MPKYAELLYNGFWFSPEREALQAAIDSTQKFVTGTVRLKLYKVDAHPPPPPPASPHPCTISPSQNTIHWNQPGLENTHAIRSVGFQTAFRRYNASHRISSCNESEYSRFGERPASLATHLSQVVCMLAYTFRTLGILD